MAGEEDSKAPVSGMLEGSMREDALGGLGPMGQIPASNGDGYLQDLQAISQEAHQGVVPRPQLPGAVPGAQMQGPVSGAQMQGAVPGSQMPMGPEGQAPLAMAATDDMGDVAMSPKKDGKGRASLLDMSETERIRRRREINRNSQRRIRERRSKELDELRTEATRMQHESEQLIRQVECITAEKAELLRQIQDLTEKWQQSIAENAVLNRENLQLRSSLQQLTGLPGMVAGSIAGGVPASQAQKVVGKP
ncbi:unnamed protein product [Ostreobium quekettii]|uniref:BZIP domain-containing protein n=1 Tax=Ostreobium quekettii TaxID=121088 RepID=A0A8S1IXY1_9CHLO|nr:unnamed protein product [Ostreobium quekettii]|eukprot:evm.model.scf_1155.1 EVM.evm.TU.scf_1155.1   scf_1155:7502-11575(+)